MEATPLSQIIASSGARSLNPNCPWTANYCMPEFRKRNLGWRHIDTSVQRRSQSFIIQGYRALVEVQDQFPTDKSGRLSAIPSVTLSALPKARRAFSVMAYSDLLCSGATNNSC